MTTVIRLNDSKENQGHECGKIKCWPSYLIDFTEHTFWDNWKHVFTKGDTSFVYANANCWLMGNRPLSIKINGTKEKSKTNKAKECISQIRLSFFIRFQCGPTK